MPIRGDIYAPLVTRQRHEGFATLGDFFQQFEQQRANREALKDREEQRAMQRQDRELRQQEIDLRNQTIAAQASKLKSDEEKIAATRQVLAESTDAEGNVDLRRAVSKLYTIDPPTAMEFQKYLDEQAKEQRAAETSRLQNDKTKMETEKLYQDMSRGPAAAPFTLGPGAKRFAPDGSVIAEVPPTAGAAGGGFTLSPGATRYDAQGKPIATAPNRPPQGATGRPVLSGDAGRIADFNTSLDDLKALESVVQDTGTVAKIQSWMPQWINDLTGGWGDDAKSRNAVIARVKQVIGKALEGGVLRKEDEEKYKDILPTIGDSKVVAQSKLKGLRESITKRRLVLIESLGDAGFDTTRYNERIQSGPTPTMRFNPATGKVEPIQ